LLSNSPSRPLVFLSLSLSHPPYSHYKLLTTTMSYTPAASSSSFITNRPTSTRTKRRLSNATPAAALDHSDHEDEEDYSKQPRSKRNRAVRATSEGDEDGESAAGDSISQSGSRGGAGGTTTKALSEKEKDARRQARMIRNRSELHPPSPSRWKENYSTGDRSPGKRELNLTVSFRFDSPRCRSSFSRPQEGTHALPRT
jgi:hypothetical protein